MMTVYKQIFLEILNSLKSVARQGITLFVSASLTFQPFFCQTAFANPSHIIPDGTTNTTLELSPNNITVVNIATPTGSGTSMNSFDQFNVDQSGAILNNSAIIVNTQLGGWIYANTHLANGTQARVIVGEVTSTAPSNLLGYTEIAGGKAEFVLLNPNGISCVGCGFINLSSLTLATGSGIYNAAGDLSNINMGAGNFSVTGVGLDASLVDYFRVISKNIKLSAPIWAKNELAIYQGSSNFNVNTNIFSGTPNPNVGQLIGIDAFSMGSMYAGKVLLVASDLGLGVNIASDVIASNGDITITANGDIVYNNALLNAKNDVTIQSNQNIESNGTNIFAQSGNINLDAKNLTNSSNSTIVSAKNININASNIFNNNGYILSFGEANLTNFNNQNGYLESNKSVLITNNNFGLNNSGGIIQSDNGDTTINSNYQFINANGKINSSNNVILNINSDQNYTDRNSKINAQNNIYLNSNGFDITNSGDIIANSKLFEMNAKNLTNSGLISSNGITNVNISEKILNKGSIVTNNNLFINASNDIDNNGFILSNKNISITAQNLNNITTEQNLTSAKIWAKDNMNIDANQVNNIGRDNFQDYVSNGTYNPWIIPSQSESDSGSLAALIDSIPKQNGSGYDILRIYNPWYGSLTYVQIDTPVSTLTSTNSQIISGNDMTINANILNQQGNILSGNNLYINGNVENNVTHFQSGPILIVISEFWRRWYMAWEYRYYDLTSTTPSQISAANSLIITGDKISNDQGGATFSENSPISGNSGSENSGQSGSFASSFKNTSNLNSDNLSSPNVDLSSIVNPTLLTNNPNPPTLHLSNSKGDDVSFSYLNESRIQFADQGSFLSSSYFFTHLDYFPSRQIIMIGDPYTERRIVEDTIAKTGMTQYLGNGAIDELYANGLKYLEGKTTKVGYELTQSQIDALEEDIVIPVEKEINGKLVMVPQVYWSKATLAKAKDQDKAGGQITAGKDIVINETGEIINKGYIASGGNSSLLTKGNFNNIGGEISSNGNLNISANSVLLDALTQKDQVQNVSKINTGGSLTISSDSDIIGNGASILTKGDLNLNAKNDITFGAVSSTSSFGSEGSKYFESRTKTIASTIQSTEKDININTGGDFSLLSGQDEYKYHKETTTKGHGGITGGSKSTTTIDKYESENVASSITADIGNIAIKSNNNINVLASNIKSANNLELSAKNNVNIVAAKDKAYNSTQSSWSGFLGSSQDVNSKYNETISSSSITATNSILISSGNDVNILGSVVTGKDGEIKANNDVNIASIQLINKIYNFHQEASMDVGAVIVGAVAGAIGGLIVGGPAGAIGGGIGGAVAGSQQFNIDAVTKEDSVIENVGSVLLMKGDLAIFANKGIVDASSIKADTLTVDVQDGDKDNEYGGLNLQSEQNQSILVIKTFEQRTDYINFAFVQGVKGAATTYVGGIADDLTFQGFSAIIGLSYTAATYNTNEDRELSLEQTLYTNQYTTRSKYFNSTEINSSVLFNNLIVK